jgi:ferritin-like metal-binding protein YciE
LAVLAGGYERFASREEEIVAQKIMDPRELFLHDLGAMLKAERDIAKALPRMQRAASDAEPQSRLERHVGETRRHVGNLEQAFKRLGARPKPGRAAGAEALGQEFKSRPPRSGASLRTSS